MTSHPLDPYRLEMQLLCTPLEQLNQGLEAFNGKEITIAGLITAKREGKAKNGKDFGFITLEDFSGTYELAFFGKDYADWHQYFIDKSAIYVKGKIVPKWGKAENELAFSIQKVNLLEAITENAIRSITLQVEVEKLTNDLISEIYELFILDVSNSNYKELQEKKKKNKEDDFNVQNKEIPLHFELFDRSNNSVKMFSRTCKIKKSRELYEYFENNDAVKMKIN